MPNTFVKYSRDGVDVCRGFFYHGRDTSKKKNKNFVEFRSDGGHQVQDVVNQAEPMVAFVTNSHSIDRAVWIDFFCHIFHAHSVSLSASFSFSSLLTLLPTRLNWFSPNEAVSLFYAFVSIKSTRCISNNIVSKFPLHRWLLLPLFWARMSFFKHKER